MNELLENSFYSFFQGNETENCREYARDSDLNRKLLRRRLSKNERKLLLRIIDANDSITEEKSFQCYLNGFKLGLKIGYETNRV